MLREGGSHSVFVNRDARKVTTVPRHREINDFLARKICRDLGVDTKRLEPGVLDLFLRYDWPGNVRELQNVIAWMAVQSPRRGRIGPAGLPAHVARAPQPAVDA